MSFKFTPDNISKPKLCSLHSLESDKWYKGRFEDVWTRQNDNIIREACWEAFNLGASKMSDAVRRFALFMGDTYYPAGGWGDFHSSYNLLEEAEEACKTMPDFDWAEIVDLESGEVVRSIPPMFTNVVQLTQSSIVLR